MQHSDEMNTTACHPTEDQIMANAVASPWLWGSVRKFDSKGQNTVNDVG